MEDKNSLNQIPDRWQKGVREMRSGKKRECYRCPESQQLFFKYEDMMRYVKYAKEANLSIYSPNFHRNKRKRRGGLPAGKQLLSGQSSKPSAYNHFMGDSSESDSASEAESVPSQARPEAVLVPSRDSTNQAVLVPSQTSPEAVLVPTQESTNQDPTPPRGMKQTPRRGSPPPKGMKQTPRIGSHEEDSENRES